MERRIYCRVCSPSDVAPCTNEQQLQEMDVPDIANNRTNLQTFDNSDKRLRVVSHGTTAQVMNLARAMSRVPYVDGRLYRFTNRHSDVFEYLEMRRALDIPALGTWKDINGAGLAHHLALNRALEPSFNRAPCESCTASGFVCSTPTHVGGHDAAQAGALDTFTASIDRLKIVSHGDAAQLRALLTGMATRAYYREGQLYNFDTPPLFETLAHRTDVPEIYTWADSEGNTIMHHLIAIDTPKAKAGLQFMMNHARERKRQR